MPALHFQQIVQRLPGGERLACLLHAFELGRIRANGFKFPAERKEYLGEILEILHKVDPALAMKKIEQLGEPQLQATLKALVETGSE